MTDISATVALDVGQEGNRITIRADGIDDLFFAVEGIELPPRIDASFVVWALLPLAMEEGFNLHINHPIDPQVAANAEHVSRIWEMWTPSRYRSVKVSGQGAWSRAKAVRRPQVQLFSGGIDSAYSILRNRDVDPGGYVATVCGVDRTEESNFARLVDKTEPLLKALGYNRISIRTNVQREPAALTHAFTLAGSLFLLGDLFEQGTLAADSTYAEGMLWFPWGSNRVTNAYFAGSDFSVQTVGAEARRTEKIAAIAAAGLDPRWLSFCRKRSAIPENCGRCGKCSRTKTMFLAATGAIPEIFIDNSFDESLVRRMARKPSDRASVFDIYFCAQDRGVLDDIPGLAELIDRYRNGGDEGLSQPR
jgi:hypothetical protein